MKTFLKLTLLLLLLAGLSACGGGGGTAATATAYTKAVVKIAITGDLPQGTMISGAGFTLALPAGVTMATNNDGAVANGYVTPSGIFTTGTLTPPVYSQSESPKTLKLALASGSEAGENSTGEIVTLFFDLAPGIEPTVWSFALSDAAVIDATLYVAIPGLNLSVMSVSLQ